LSKQEGRVKGDRLNDQALVRMIFADEVIRQSVEFLALMMLNQKQDGNIVGTFEINVRGRSVAARHWEIFDMCLLPPGENQSPQT
jgi:hypothetical protein